MCVYRNYNYCCFHRRLDNIFCWFYALRNCSVNLIYQRRFNNIPGASTSRFYMNFLICFVFLCAATRRIDILRSLLRSWVVILDPVLLNSRVCRAVVGGGCLALAFSAVFRVEIKRAPDVSISLPLRSSFA